MLNLFRSLVFVPGNNPRFLEKAKSLTADIVCFDLEDSVPDKEKKKARVLIRNTLKQRNKYSPDVFVRTNSPESGLIEADLKEIVQKGIDGIVIPKVNSAKELKKIEKIDLNKPLKFKDNIYDVLMCVGTFTYGHVKPKALDELIRITKNRGLICFTINEGIYEEYGFDKKIKELSDNKTWNVKEFFKSDYITTKDVEAWLCLAEIIK